jgi:phage major head subunit gpT-like protein
MDINATVIDAIYQNLRKDFEKGIAEGKTIADPLYQTVPSTSNANVYSWLGHLPGFKEWFKGQPRVLRNVESFDYTVANRKFEDTITIAVDDVNDNQLNQYAPIARNIGAVGKLVPDELIFDLFNNGFTTTLTYDALPWFSASHTVGLSTVNNLRTSVLNEASLEEAIRAITGFKVKPDKLSKARPLNPVANKLMLVVPTALQTTADKLVSIERNSNGADNYLYKKAAILVAPWLTSDTAWFLVNAGGPITPVYLQTRENLQFRNLSPKDSDSCFNLDTLVFGAKCRMAALPTYPWLVIGSNGTTAS